MLCDEFKALTAVRCLSSWCMSLGKMVPSDMFLLASDFRQICTPRKLLITSSFSIRHGSLLCTSSVEKLKYLRGNTSEMEYPWNWVNTWIYRCLK